MPYLDPSRDPATVEKAHIRSWQDVERAYRFTNTFSTNVIVEPRFTESQTNAIRAIVQDELRRQGAVFVFTNGGGFIITNDMPVWVPNREAK